MSGRSVKSLGGTGGLQGCGYGMLGSSVFGLKRYELINIVNFEGKGCS